MNEKARGRRKKRKVRSRANLGKEKEHLLYYDDVKSSAKNCEKTPPLERGARLNGDKM